MTAEDHTLAEYDLTTKLGSGCQHTSKLTRGFAMAEEALRQANAVENRLDDVMERRRQDRGREYFLMAVWVLAVMLMMRVLVA